MRYFLLHDGKEHALHGDTMVIGRSGACNITLDHESVSRRHARIAVSRDEVTIHDLDSPNGVYVNGRRIVGHQVIEAGDEILIGEEDVHLVALTPETIPPPRDSEGDDEEDGLDGIDVTSINDATALLCATSRRLLESGRASDAARILGESWPNLMARGHMVHPALGIFAARTAFRVAVATENAKWADDAAILLASADVDPNAETLEDIRVAVDALGMTSATRALLRHVLTKELADEARALIEKMMRAR